MLLILLFILCSLTSLIINATNGIYLHQNACVNFFVLFIIFFANV